MTSRVGNGLSWPGAEEDIAAALGLGSDASVREVLRSGGGTSWETYLVSVVGTDPRRYAVKRAPTAGVFATYDVEREVLLLAAARSTGCPVPEVVAWEPTADGVRGFYVMEFIDGLIPTPATVTRLLPDADRRRALGRDAAAVMARLHGTGLHESAARVLGPPPDAGDLGRQTVDWCRRMGDATRGNEPLLELVLAWLEENADKVSGRVAMTHHDFHTGNFVVAGDRVASVLDWEGAAWGDPVCDLAKFMMPTYAGDTGLAGGLLMADEFVDAYASEAGWRPEEPALRFWSVMSLARTMTILVRGAAAFVDGTTQDLRYANMAYKIGAQARWLLAGHRQALWGAE